MATPQHVIMTVAGDPAMKDRRSAILLATNSVGFALPWWVDTEHRELHGTSLRLYATCAVLVLPAPYIVLMLLSTVQAGQGIQHHLTTYGYMYCVHTS